MAITLKKEVFANAVYEADKARGKKEGDMEYLHHPNKYHIIAWITEA